jgi:hypothetical protein
MRGAVFLSHDDDTSLFPFSILCYEIYVQRAEWIEVDIIIVEWEWTFFCVILVGALVFWNEWLFLFSEFDAWRIWICRIFARLLGDE